ncbi:MAG: T9SS type A sorting domain-containing protein, partial [Bacteroidota bacterium]
LQLTKTKTAVYERLPGQVIELTEGELFRGVARTQDAMIVDTLGGPGHCPQLQPIILRVVPARSEREVFPNPVIDRLTIGLTQRGGLISVDIFKMDGALAFQQNISLADDSREATLSLRHLPRGAYLCRILHQDKITYHKLIRP